MFRFLLMALCFSAACSGTGGSLDDAGQPSGTPDSGSSLKDAGGAAMSDAGGIDAGRPDAGRRVSIIVATGKMGRRTISCDDGLSWPFDFAVDDLLPVNERFPCGSGDHGLPDGGVVNNSSTIRIAFWSRRSQLLGRHQYRGNRHSVPFGESWHRHALLLSSRS